MRRWRVIQLRIASMLQQSRQGNCGTGWSTLRNSRAAAEARNFHVDSTMTPYEWMKELGAVRPMAPAGVTILVLGEWADGFYPISYTRMPKYKLWNGQSFDIMPEEDKWELFGFRVFDVTRKDVERIMRALGIIETAS